MARPAGIQRISGQFDRGWVEVAGYIYACAYAPGYFGDLSDDDIEMIIRKHYRERPKKFRPYNMSTGHFLG